MPLNGVQGSQPPARVPQAPPPQAPAPLAPQPSPAAKGTDRLALSGPAPVATPALSDAVARARAAQAFDVEATSERLIGHHQGNLETAYFESLDLRNTTREPGYAAKLSAYSQKLGMARDLNPDELRDIEHYLFAAASVAEKGAPASDASYLERVGAVLAREPHAVGLAALTVGYSAAKAVNRVLPQDLKFLKSRTAPSLDEVGAGLKGIWRGLKDQV
ncbi:hypothetical protein J7643_19785 [bacterium]|nr:hypothetical protein [bacterium]